MKLVTTKFKSGGLHEKHVVATWNLGNHLSICFWAQGNQEKPVSRWLNLCRNDVSADMYGSAFKTSAGILSAPAAFPFFIAFMALTISLFEGDLILIGSSVFFLFKKKVFLRLRCLQDVPR